MAVWLCWPAHLRNVNNNIYTNAITDRYLSAQPCAHTCTHDLQRSDFLFSYMSSCIRRIHQLHPSILHDYPCIIHRKCVRLWLYSPTFSIHGQSPRLHLHPDSAHFIPTTWPLGHQWAVNDAALFFFFQTLSPQSGAGIWKERERWGRGRESETRWKSRAKRRKVIKVRWDWKSDWRPHLINQSCRGNLSVSRLLFIGHWGLANITH